MPLTVNLNASNYVSDKTKAAFEKALADGHKTPTGENGHDRKPENGNGHRHRETSGGQPPLPVLAAPVIHLEAEQRRMTDLADYTRLMETLERGLAQAHEHQTLTLRAHEQYLSHQADYAALFAQLLQQQGEIFAASRADLRQAELAAKVLESFAQSLARFHDLQTETLSVHKQFLNQQAEFSQVQAEPSTTADGDG